MALPAGLSERNNLVMEAHQDGTVQRRDFHHPYEPYPIQLDLMNALYDCIQNRQIGIFESPTGVSNSAQGKSLSLLCASITWLRDHQLHGHIDADDCRDEDEPQWILEQVRKERMEDFVSQKERISRHLQKVRDKERAQKNRFESGEPPRKRFRAEKSSNQTSDTIGEDLFLIDDYESDNEAPGQSKAREGAREQLSAKTQDVLKQLGMAPSFTESESIEYFEATKVFYCSRTHSQLSQLATEVQKVQNPGAGYEIEPGSPAEAEGIKYLTLGSRKNLCINPKVNHLNSTISINERCLQLQQSKNDSVKKCPYIPTSDNQTLVHDFRDHALAKVRDIEDLANLGRAVGVCPYYASRAAIRPSELVTLPYPLLLQKAARDSLEISLRDNIVIIDEAHNLVDAITGIYSAYVTLEQLKLARAQLSGYLQRFRNKVKAKNRVYLAQILRVIDSLTLFLTNREVSKSASHTTTVPDLLASKGADQIDLFRLSTYLRESKLARKVDGYVEFTSQQSIDSTSQKPTLPVLCHIESFLLTLTNTSAEGRLFYERAENGDAQLKYMLLDPTSNFKDIVDEARSVILIGGTMSPMNELRERLFSYADPNRVKTLSCGHVIPDENLMAWSISSGVGSVEFDFTFEKRKQPTILESLGRTLVRLSQSIPHGLVCFFPSYAYLDLAMKAWKSRSSGVFSQLEQFKEVFTDSKESSKVDDVLGRYSEAVHRSNGAALMSVVGGKMSEGINFSDELGRCVVIIGLPFPNANSIEWKTRMEYVQQSTIARGGTSAEGSTAARECYENACMRAVNQSIGRAIRHRNDYATIIMLDKRYSTPRIQNKLPAWIQKRLITQKSATSFDKAMQKVDQFFAQR